MPYANFHTARLQSPSKFDDFRTTEGGKLYDKITVPKTINIIWGHVKGEDKDSWAPQALRFDKDKFTADEAKTWLKENEIEYSEFVVAKEDGKSDDYDDAEDEEDEEDEKSISASIEHKTFRFNISHTKESIIKDQKYGYVSGYVATYGNVDRGSDSIQKGAFTESLNRYKNDNRVIKLYYNHNTLETPIGQIPISTVKDDDNGLFCEARLNLSLEKSRDVYNLLKDGTLSDFSIGYSVNRADFSENGKVRLLKGLELWEASVVGEPMNPKAKVTSVKTNEQNKEIKKFKVADAQDLQSEEVKQVLLELNFPLSEKHKKALIKRGIEDILTKSGKFTQRAARYLAGYYSEPCDAAGVKKTSDLSEISPVISKQLQMISEILSKN